METCTIEQPIRPFPDRLVRYRKARGPGAFKLLAAEVGCSPAANYLYSISRGLQPGAALAARLDAALRVHGF